MIRILTLFLGVLSSLILSPNRTNAAEIEVEKNKEGYTYITISGRLYEEDGKRFAETVLSTKSQVVFLNSAGGSTEAAISIGKVIRDHRMATIVANTDYCASACALIWLAGERRLLTPKAKVGFHAVYVLKDNVKFVSAMGNALVGRYLTLLNLPEQAVIFATASGPETLNWLDPSKRWNTGIEYDVLDNMQAAAKADTAALAKIYLVKGLTSAQLFDQTSLQN